MSTSRNIVTQVFLRLDRRDLKIWIKGKYLGGGNFGKVIYMYVILKVYFIILRNQKVPRNILNLYSAILPVFITITLGILRQITFNSCLEIQKITFRS